MLKVSIQTKVNGKWEEIVVPEKLSERIAMMTEVVGTETVIKIETSCCLHFLCGTEELRKTMAKVQATKAPPGSAVVMTIADAHALLEQDPEKFCISIQLFSTKEHCEALFPAKQGWIDPDAGK